MTFFNAEHLPQPSHEYVAWIDVMGTQASMARSIRMTANFICKLHIAALEATRPGLKLYPVMDGVYAATPDQGKFLDFARKLFSSLAKAFVATSDPQHRFLIRGGAAFGPVYHGDHIGKDAAPTLAKHPEYRKALLLGLPMVQAFKAEPLAPPFGLAIDESARGFAPVGREPFHHAWWHWRTPKTEIDWNGLEKPLTEYLEWYARRALPLGYPTERIVAHREMYAQLRALNSR